MAVNKYPWVKNLGGDTKPLIFPGKVQAGSTQAIKRGEICTFDETSSYFIPANAIADARYSLAIANEEQKSGDSARYMEFIALRPEDVFEFTLSAAAGVAIGDGLILVASQSQQLTQDVDGSGGRNVAFVVGKSNYPETGTTLRTLTSAEVVFSPAFSYWCQRALSQKIQKIIHSTADITLKYEDCGAVLICTGAQAVTLPASVVPAGWCIEIVVAGDAAVTIDPKPDTAKIFIKGAAQAAGKYISMTDIGDFVKLIWDGADWYAVNSLSGADADITVET